MENSTGTVLSVKNGGNEDVITEDGSNANLNFINPHIPSVSPGERFDFLKIIQSTPNGEKVINILKVKMPQ